MSEMSFLVNRVKLSFESEISVIYRHRPELDLLQLIADRHHRQLRLHGVDHVGHGVGEELFSSSVNLVTNHTEAE